MGLVFILLLTYFLQGGLIVTHSSVAHSDSDCREAAELIVANEEDQIADVAAYHRKVLKLVPTCVEINPDASI